MAKQAKKKKYVEGIYTPKNKSKYKGNIKEIIYRSSYELQFMHFCDNNPAIIEWSSEETVIPYIKPTDGRVHRYFLDFWIKYYTNEFEKELPYWELVNEEDYSEDKQKNIQLIKDGKAQNINLIKGETPPSDTIGKINSLYLNVITKDLYLKKEGNYILNINGQKIKKIKKAIIEIKPFIQTQKPKPQARITDAFKTKMRTYLINEAKWESAERYAQKNGMEFIIITEQWLKNSK